MFFKQELLYDNHLSINGSKLEETGFKYNFPELTVDALREVSSYLFGNIPVLSYVGAFMPCSKDTFFVLRYFLIVLVVPEDVLCARER